MRTHGQTRRAVHGAPVGTGQPPVAAQRAAACTCGVPNFVWVWRVDTMEGVPDLPESRLGTKEHWDSVYEYVYIGSQA